RAARPRAPDSPCPPPPGSPPSGLPPAPGIMPLRARRRNRLATARGSAAAVLRRVRDALADRRVDDLRRGDADPLVPDHAAVVDQVERRRRGEVPSPGDRAAAGRSVVRERTPRQPLLVHHLTELGGGVVDDVDAEQRERLVLP